MKQKRIDKQRKTTSGNFTPRGSGKNKRRKKKKRNKNRRKPKRKRKH